MPYYKRLKWTKENYLSIPTLAITILLLAGSSLAAAATNLGAVNNTITTTTTTTTPIKHLIVIFQENISFDHYFGTYPYAKNSPGEPSFLALPDTPSINGLTKALLNK